jgi:hypothetical protein
MAAANPAPWLTAGYPEGDPDELDRASAAEFIAAAVSVSGGRYACGECADNRDAAERSDRQLAKAHALLRLILRAEMRPAKREAADDTPHDLALIGFSTALAAIKARIEIYFQGVRS